MRWLQPIRLAISNAKIQSELFDVVYIWTIPGILLPFGNFQTLLRSIYGLLQSRKIRNSRVLLNRLFSRAWICSDPKEFLFDDQSIENCWNFRNHIFSVYRRT